MSKNAAILREMRLDKRLTQKEVADDMGVSQATYSLIERGEKPRSIAEAMKTVNVKRTRTDRTDGGDRKTGRLKD